MKKSNLLSIITLVLLVIANIVPARASVIPAGLNPGDHYQLAFVTSTTINGASSNISDYNVFVNSAANLTGSLVEGITFYAIGSTATVNAINNAVQAVGANFKGVYNLNGAKVSVNQRCPVRFLHAAV
jgi:hypothetical protein